MFLGIIYPTNNFQGLNGYNNDQGIFVNYTKVEESVGTKYNISPRKQFCDAKVASDFGEKRAKYDSEYMKEYEKQNFVNVSSKWTMPKRENIPTLFFNYSSCLMLIDTDREKEIGLGASYNFAKLDVGECFINNQMAESLKVTTGDVIYNQLNLYANLMAMIDLYNTNIAISQGKVQINRYVVYPGSFS